MVRRFVPVTDQERPRCEQDEESLRRHRKFDAPHTNLPKDLNDPHDPKQDMEPLGRPTGELEQDAAGLWKKKESLFERKMTWGRETFEYSNPEVANADGAGKKTDRGWHKGTLGWGVLGKFGGSTADVGLDVLQRGEVDQKLVLNEKGLWVKKESHKSSGSKEGSAREEEEEEAEGRPRRGEDPRLEAAKPKSRGGDSKDRADRALQALKERRAREQPAQERLGKDRPVACARVGGGAAAEQLRPAKRATKYQRWQGVQRSEEEAKKVLAMAEGGAAAGMAGVAVRQAPFTETKRLPKRRSPSASSGGEPPLWQSPSPKRSRSRSRSSRAAAVRDAGGDSVEVDFF